MLRRIIETEFNVVVKGKHGFICYNKNDKYIGKSISLYGEYSEQEAYLFKSFVKGGDIVIDVGANIGTHSIVFSNIVGNKGRVYSFEPQSVVFQTLCANMALNSKENVVCFPNAVSSKNGLSIIPKIDYKVEMNFGGIELNKNNQGNRVYMIKLDTFLDLPKLEFIKIDVEGMEFDVIYGAKYLIEKFKPFLYVENDRLKKSQCLIELIQSLNYNIYSHKPLFYNQLNFAGNKECPYDINLQSYNLFCVHQSANNWDESLISKHKLEKINDAAEKKV